MRFLIDVVASLTPNDHHVCILGNVPVIMLKVSTSPTSTTWTATVEGLELPTLAIEYKYAIASTQDHTFVVWESLPLNRTVVPEPMVLGNQHRSGNSEVHDGWFGLDTRELGDCSKLHIEVRMYG
ncbi:hypothetical protein H257_13979 [Aphanomyces astaci]|uniref:Uncharacterized protein n=1 Tax=Aphanomyces astaci TaxID=112090 RepID=W4FUZ3_APHAT|nr:hypothetical protein H257_13979 [Aphanomyces astaci]ETV70604.1 hypothetical protein H257_13979 [Aphanomyces astaci]|eukprot:XP_009839987.1 hypothetical protein H257_13979 [Aphanomyces astaci]